MTTRKKRLTDAQLDRMIAHTKAQIQVGKQLLTAYGAAPDELATYDQPVDPAPLTPGDTVDLYGNGDRWMVTAITDDRSTCTIEQLPNTNRR